MMGAKAAQRLVAQRGRQLGDGVLGGAVLTGDEGVQRGAVLGRRGVPAGEERVERLDHGRARQLGLQLLGGRRAAGHQVGVGVVDRVGRVDHDRAGQRLAELRDDARDRMMGHGQHDDVRAAHSVNVRRGRRAGRGRGALGALALRRRDDDVVACADGRCGETAADVASSEDRDAHVSRLLI
jgi:hypothetical protein